jgi:hypothetical protein
LIILGKAASRPALHGVEQLTTLLEVISRRLSIRYEGDIEGEENAYFFVRVIPENPAKNGCILGLNSPFLGYKWLFLG